MNTPLKARWYVWIFVCCLVVNVRLFLPASPAVEPYHVDLSFYVISNLLVIPMFMVWLMLQLTKETTNRLEKVFLILVAVDAALLIRAFSPLGYLHFYVSPRITLWAFFVATAILGYRMDQVLRTEDGSSTPTQPN